MLNSEDRFILLLCVVGIPKERTVLGDSGFVGGGEAAGVCSGAYTSLRFADAGQGQVDMILSGIEKRRQFLGISAAFAGVIKNSFNPLL